MSVNEQKEDKIEEDLTPTIFKKLDVFQKDEKITPIEFRKMYVEID
jgi:hypothetical protein